LHSGGNQLDAQPLDDGELNGFDVRRSRGLDAERLNVEEKGLFRLDAEFLERAAVGGGSGFGHVELKAPHLHVEVVDLIAAIEDFLNAWNQNPKPFVWTTTMDSIVEKLSRSRQTLEQIQPGCTVPKSRKRLSS
jgi:hypothetical protein